MNKTGVWLSQISLPKDYDSFISTPYSYIEYPTQKKPFTQQPFLLPMNIIILFDISSSNSRTQELFTFLRRLTPMQYLYFLPFNNNPQEPLHNGMCTEQSINQLLQSICKISYGGGTRYHDAFKKMIEDVKQKRDKTHNLDIFLVSDGNEIQNRKLLKKELNELKEYVYSIHSINTGDGTWNDKLLEISCQYNGYNMNINKKSIDELFSIFWIKSLVKENQHYFQDAQVFTGKNDTSIIFKELIDADVGDTIFPYRNYGTIGLIITDDEDDKTTENIYTHDQNTDERIRSLQLRAIRQYLGELCGDEVQVTTEEQEKIDYSLRKMNDWYETSNDFSGLYCAQSNSTIDVQMCVTNGVCNPENQTNYYMRQTCGCKFVSMLLLIFIMILFI